MTNTFVAVYGTLKQGGSNHYLLKKGTLVCKGVVRGFTMHSLGGFPGVHKTRDQANAVKVEVYEVDATTLRNLDRLEGTNPDNLTDKNNLFNRVDVADEFMPPTDDSYFELFMYVPNFDVTMRPTIWTGDWPVGK